MTANLQVIFRPCTQVAKWEWHPVQDPKCGTLPSLSNDTSAHALTLWSQVGKSTTATGDICIDQLKLPILLSIAQIPSQMTVHPIPITLCLPQRPWNPATVHGIINRNLPQPPVLKSPSQMSRTQPEVVARFAALKDLTYRVTNRHLYKCGYSDQSSLLLSWIPYCSYWLKDIGHFVEFCIINFRTLHYWL